MESTDDQIREVHAALERLYHNAHSDYGYGQKFKDIKLIRGWLPLVPEPPPPRIRKVDELAGQYADPEFSAEAERSFKIARYAIRGRDAEMKAWIEWQIRDHQIGDGSKDICVCGMCRIYRDLLQALKEADS